MVTIDTHYQVEFNQALYDQPKRFEPMSETGNYVTAEDAYAEIVRRHMAYGYPLSDYRIGKVTVRTEVPDTIITETRSVVTVPCPTCGK